jgi:hypothetical protein
LPRDDATTGKLNRAGLFNLIRYANGQGFHLDFSGLYNLRGEPPKREPLFLYVAGAGEFQSLADPQMEGLRRYLDAGGTLFGDAVGGAPSFASGFKRIAEKVGASLTRVDASSPVMRSHHLFAGAPIGAFAKGELLADLQRGVFLSTFDYGGAWQGQLKEDDPAAAREIVRNAQDFGLNIVLQAAQRQRRIELEKIA